MRAVAERLVLRRAATAERHAVAHLIAESVGARHGNASAHPQRPGAVLDRILDQTDGGLIMRLDRLSARVVPRDQPARRAVAGLAYEILFRLGVVCFAHQSPDLPVGVAKARESTKALGIRQRHGRTREDLRLLAVGLAARRLGAVEADSGVGPVAKRLCGAA